MSLTYIPGKDAALEASIERLNAAVSNLGFHIEEARWLNPAPYIWSVHIRDRDCPQVFSNGKGASREAALASAYGELIERLSTRYLWADFYLTPVLDQHGFVHQHDEQWFAGNGQLPADLLDDKTRERYDPEAQLTLAELKDMNGGDSGKGVCAVPYIRQRDQAKVLFPINVIGNLFVSNGMSAGNNRDEAIVQGLSEIFERAIKNRIISEAITLPEVPAEVIARYPKIEAGLEALNKAGFTLRALDASLGGRYPVMCVILQNPNDYGVYASFGAHPRFEVALERALTELLQGRALDELEGFPAPTTDMDMVSDPHNLELHFIDSSGYVSWALLSDEADIAFADWDDSRDNAATREALIELLHEEGHDVYIAEYTALGAYACRILVPGFSEIYPADELKWQNNNQALPYRSLLCQLAIADEVSWRTLLEALEQHAVNEQLRVLEWAGIVGDKGTPWARLRIGELKLWLQLALGEQEEAFDQLGMVLSSGHLDNDERAQLRALSDVLELQLAGAELDNYRRALNAYHGETLVEEAEELSEGRLLFPGLDELDPLAPTQAHARLLEAYEKVIRAQSQPA
ncbi:30S ribosomal protein S12 methylthiotransferase accessory factor YcaO [Phytohalomonas tamaricis]|uniref:30S ribosomal protein S12 methylthiotransferase accessory factor YcaO n=1 Tax=Phytohalomonas tamaricis TaxID=2081032 RepID=UPI000D0BAC92|nr:30S ribosomal protein S12 methylthiotransferase accessory factor YcaO [Phytohalomonas tamaricis]